MPSPFPCEAALNAQSRHACPTATPTAATSMPPSVTWIRETENATVWKCLRTHAIVSSSTATTGYATASAVPPFEMLNGSACSAPPPPPAPHAVEQPQRREEHRHQRPPAAADLPAPEARQVAQDRRGLVARTRRVRVRHAPVEVLERQLAALVGRAQERHRALAP